MTEEPRSRSCATNYSEKVEKYLKRPEGLVFETDHDFLGNLEVMQDLAIKFKRDNYLTYLPRELKNNEEFMLKLIEKRPNAYDYVGQKLSKNPEFAVKAIRTNPDAIDAVFFKYENFFNNIQVINEALKHEQSDMFNVTEEIDEYIHKKNICSKEDLLEMFSGKCRVDYLVKSYEHQVKAFIDDKEFIAKVSEKNDFDFIANEVTQNNVPEKKLKFA